MFDYDALMCLCKIASSRSIVTEDIPEPEVTRPAAAGSTPPYMDMRDPYLTKHMCNGVCNMMALLKMAL
jgi:hypothetical protein